ncbi:4'-phosphopantetheinyl transferase family protein [Lysinibacillus parviboronicapiens]|uniref:4'-phosphopantetheinyl transferase n=1 Tax=Lysinibacillus parviboronicapiens TaxID=436516 RepID=A0ABV2PEV8_9BACI|nr:4'-phosphopantetheinyl transferase superfamily protein [Lysinibacillus parviboronicapiens]
MEIFGVNIAGIKPEHSLNELIKLISVEKRNKIKSYRKKEDYLRSLTAELLIRVILVKKGLFQNEDIQFEYNNYGKPLLKNSSIKFNISHSGDWVVCAVSNFLVGIDIEEIRSYNVSAIKDSLTANEFNTLIDLSKNDRSTFFFNLWTLKESYIKAVGKGLSIPLKSISFEMNDNEIIFTNRYNNDTFNFKQYEIDNRYKLSVCNEKTSFPKEICIWSFHKLYHDSINLLK